jgi:hypothetical protein
METNQQREAALKLLASTGILRSNYEPPLLRLLWRLGLNVPPPHFASFWGNAVVSGVFFAVGWGSLMWFLLWSRQGMSLAVFLVAAIVAGVLFGATMAGYYSYGKRKHALPSWRELPGAAA